MSVARDKVVMDYAGGRLHASDHLKKALVDQGHAVNEPLLEEVWSSIRDCGARLSEDRSEVKKLSLDSPRKRTLLGKGLIFCN